MKKSGSPKKLKASISKGGTLRDLFEKVTPKNPGQKKSASDIRKKK
jgi:hypothetical protein